MDHNGTMMGTVVLQWAFFNDNNILLLDNGSQRYHDGYGGAGVGFLQQQIFY